MFKFVAVDYMSPARAEEERAVIVAVGQTVDEAFERAEARGFVYVTVYPVDGLIARQILECDQ